MRKTLFLLVFLLTCALIITGCQSSATSSAPTTTQATTNTSATPTTTTAPAATTAKPAATTTAAAATTVPATTAPVVSTRYGGSIKIIEASAPGTPIGAVWETPAVSACMQLSLEPLLKEQLDGTLLPRLAASYDVVSDPQNPSVTFNLRKGVKFHDGTDYDAKAVKFTLEKIKNSGYFGGTRYWKSLDIIDDYTFKIPLTEWRNSVMPMFAQNQVFIVSPTAFEKNGIDWLRWNMVGTGPFKQSDFKRDVSLTAAKFTDYYDKGKPNLDSVTYLFVADELTRLALFKSGGADVLNTNASGRIASEFQALGGYNIVPLLSGTSTLAPDGANADSPWANAKVRMAAEYAIDKESISKTFGYGYTQAAYQLPNSSSPAFIKDLANRKFDTAKARQLLTEGGFPNGFKTKIIAQNTVNKDIIVAIQSYLSKIGIQAELEFPEPAKFMEYQNGTWKNALLYYVVGQNANYNVTFGYNFGSPQAILRSLKQPADYANIYKADMTSPRVEAAFQQKIIQAFYDESTIIPINYVSDIWILNSKLKDSGWATRGSGVFWNPEDAWLSK
jgi:peptide/nickel transport system substrate-binding protein